LTSISLVVRRGQWDGFVTGFVDTALESFAVQFIEFRTFDRSR
jgi:hypothetical protein